MKQQSKRIIAILGAAALITGATGAVFAYGGYGPGYGPGWGGTTGGWVVPAACSVVRVP